MQKISKTLGRTLLALALVLFSLRPSVTNRIEKGFNHLGYTFISTSANSNMAYPGKDHHYRSSFDKNDKRALGSVVSIARVSVGVVPAVRVSAGNYSASADPSITPSEGFRVLRI